MTPAVRTLVERLCLAAMLVAATAPAWRLLGLGPAPTDDEVLQLRCSARSSTPGVTPASRAQPGSR